MIHSGVWGFASSPIVTEDEIRRITRLATEIAKASAIAKKVDVRLAPVPAYTEYWSSPMTKDPSKVSQEDKQGLAQKVVDLVVKNKDVINVNASIQLEAEWKYFASSEGSYIEQEIFTTTPSFTRDGAQGQRDAVAHLHGRPGDGRLGNRRGGRHARERASGLPPRPSSSAPRSPSTWASRTSC